MPTEVKLNDNFSYFHKYRIDGDNLMDDYNGSIAGQRKNGVWEVVTDPTIKYGALAESLGMEVLRTTNARFSLQPNTQSMYFNAVLTGEMTTIDLEGTKVYLQKVVYRDGDGTVKDPVVVLPVLELPGLIAYKTSPLGGISTKQEMIPYLEALGRYQAGKKVNITFIWDGNMTMINQIDDSNWQQIWKMIMTLHQLQASNLRIFAESWMDENKNSSNFPKGMLIPADSIKVYDENLMLP